MAKKSDFVDYVVECLTPLGYIHARAMFGGWGVYCDDVMFGLVADDILYFKVDSQTQTIFEEEGLEAFMYESKNKKPVKMSYHQAHDSVYDDQDQALYWGQLGLDAALRSRKKKKKK